MALNDDVVQKQLKHMMAFIEQEANEKAEEIDAKAEEEFNIEKGRLVQQQRLKVMEYYERKEKDVEMQRKIQASNLLNQARLKVLKAQEDHIKRVLQEAQTRVGTVIKNPQYQKLMQSLIVQSLFQLMEANVSLKCRQEDLALCKAVLPAAIDQYKKEIGKDCKVVIEETYLSPKICGGVEASAFKGKIRCVNTLESRLERIAHNKAPEIRTKLFGRNPNRKFAD